MDLNNRAIAVVGMGYVGLPLAVEFGKIRPVVGFDIDENRINELQRGYDRTLEVSKAELSLARHLRFTARPSEIRSRSVECQPSNAPMVLIVTVPTPVNKVNRPDLAPLIKASEYVGRLLKPQDIVIYESTVFPGATEEVCVPILERTSGLRFNADFFCGYSPERINPGDKTHRISNIKKVTSGSTPEAARAIDALYNQIITAGTHKVNSIKVAEAAKVIENTQRDLNIAFVNELSIIFNLMGIDTSEVLEAAATKWNFLSFKPGLVGGHCIGVDPYYLTHKAQELGYQPQVILSGRGINDEMGRYAAQNVIRLMSKNSINVANATVGILGITFKENCPDIRNSKVVDLIKEFRSWGINIKLVDPWANKIEVYEKYGLHLTEINPSEPVNSIVVAVSHREFEGLSPRQLRSWCFDTSGPIIADLKSIYDQAKLVEQGFKVFRL